MARSNRSGVVLTDVRKSASLDEGRGKPQNAYTDGKVASGSVRSCDRMRSCGFGPSKVHANEGLPTLLQVEEKVLKCLDQFGTLHLDLLASHIKESYGDTVQVVKDLTAKTLVTSTKRHGGGVTLMAEGRRIAALLAERKNGESHEETPPTD